MNAAITSPDGIPPSAPGTLSATGGIGQATLNWGAATDNVGVVRYNVHRSTTAGFSPSTANRIAQPTGTSYTDTVAAGTYYYKVTAEDALGNVGAASNEASTTVVTDTFAPTAPTSLTAGVAGGTVNLSWSAATDNVGVTRYNVHRGTTSGFTPSVANRIAQPTGLTYADSGLATGSYFYKVTAEDAAGNIGPASNEATATVADAYRPHGAQRPCSLRLRQHRQPRLDGRYRQRRRHPLQRPPRARRAASHRRRQIGSRQPTGSSFADLDCARQLLLQGHRRGRGRQHRPRSNDRRARTVLDTTPPTVSITAPVSGATVSATTTRHGERLGQRVGRRGAVQARRCKPGRRGYNRALLHFLGHVREARTVRTYLSAVARDGGGNTTTATTVPVTVQNTASARSRRRPGHSTRRAARRPPTSRARGTPVRRRTPPGSSAESSTTRSSFNGTNAWVTVPDAATLDLTTGMTSRPGSSPALTGNWRTAVVKEQPGNLVYGIYANTSANRPEAEVFVGGATRSIVGPSALPTGSWSHLAATYDGTTLRLYVDGAQVAQLAVSGSILTSNSARPDRRQRRLAASGSTARSTRCGSTTVRLSPAEIQADMDRSVTPDTTRADGDREGAGSGR